MTHGGKTKAGFSQSASPARPDSVPVLRKPASPAEKGLADTTPQPQEQGGVGEGGGRKRAMRAPEMERGGESAIKQDKGKCRAPQTREGYFIAEERERNRLRGPGMQKEG